ncbi:hypothetical protein L218DRAFT_886321 [Marasmius fiardii PR-910]|nr:hypothetical protein L218DRAFT_886321 [Marasmius fiardii PR-910]
MNKDELVALFAHHERLWTRIATQDELRWDSFPWPMLQKPSTPEDITLTTVSAYILSPHYPDKDKKPEKDRIKEHIRRWHPDRFETKLLPKVVLSEREQVKEGAGFVVRNLNELLTKSSIPKFFDDD